MTVRDAAGELLQGASVRLVRTGTDLTETASACGQAHFASLAEAADYTVTVSKTGYQSATYENVDVSGDATIEASLSAL